MKNKLFITGLPHSGKSTLLQKVIQDLPKKRGFLTREVSRDGQRTGFEVVTSEGLVATLASLEKETPIKVSRYFVDLEGLESAVSQLQKFVEGDLLYIDEVGQMELYSENFKNLVESYLNAENVFVGTLSKVYTDDFTEKIKARGDVELVEITGENRDEVQREVTYWLSERLG